MSVATVRGGVPRVIKRTVDNSAGHRVALPFHALFVQIFTASEAVKVYFEELDAANDANALLVPVAAAATPHGWEGPAEIGELWLRSNSGTDAVVTIVAYQRRG